MVKVAVSFVPLAGPPWENAKSAADPVAARHCAEYGKRPDLGRRHRTSAAGGVLLPVSVFGAVGGERRICVDNNNIPTLYRSIGDDAARKAHYLGHLWFRTLSVFREMEGPGRDETEGLSACNYPELSTSPAFIMCFSKNPLPPHYGRYILKLDCPHALSERVKKRCPDRTRVTWHKVVYDKTEHVDKLLGVNEEWERMHWHKPPRFAREEEWRLIVFLSEPFWLLNDTLKLFVGPIDLWEAHLA